MVHPDDLPGLRFRGFAEFRLLSALRAAAANTLRHLRDAMRA
jgi:hypothetical protein